MSKKRTVFNIYSISHFIRNYLSCVAFSEEGDIRNSPYSLGFLVAGAGLYPGPKHLRFITFIDIFKRHGRRYNLRPATYCRGIAKVS
jgi:hypothetical protein